MSVSRGSFLTLSSQAALAAWAASSPLRALASAPAAHPVRPSADAVLAELLAGNARYRAGKSVYGSRTARREETASGQQPTAMILSCADSRVPPEIVFDQTIGDLFVVRVAGNCVFAGGLGSFEYAFEHFHSSLLLVLGHSGCGAVTAAVDTVKSHGRAPGDIEAIVDAIAPSVRAVLSKSGDVYANAIAENARESARQLQRRAPMLRDAVAHRRLRVVSAVYDLKSGGVLLL
jgi:carbonic anhydrase